MVIIRGVFRAVFKGNVQRLKMVSYIGSSWNLLVIRLSKLQSESGYISTYHA